LSEPDGLRDVQVSRHGASARDLVAIEAPVALVLNGISHAVMMATPVDLEAFALGFAVSEGLLASSAECYGIDVIHADGRFQVLLEVAAAAERRMKERRRQMAGRTGCGLCGIESLEALELAPAPLVDPLAIEPEAIARALRELPARQVMNRRSGAHHAAAWVSPQGELAEVMEDVGRHNALDKLLGVRLRGGLNLQQGFVLMTSRASSELVLKTVRLGVPALATISAPTSLAIDIAQCSGARLYGFCRGVDAVRYA